MLECIKEITDTDNSKLALIKLEADLLIENESDIISMHFLKYILQSTILIFFNRNIVGANSCLKTWSPSPDHLAKNQRHIH
jgi:hypothetical protein